MNAKRKAQVASLDLIISAIVLMLFLGILIVVISNITDIRKNTVIYGGEIFVNIENEWEFLGNNKIDQDEYENFRNDVTADGDAVESRMFISSNVFNTNSNDFCMFFHDGTNVVGGGPVDTISGGCDESDPCPEDDYKQAYIHAKPVFREDKVVTYYIAVCQNK